MLTHKEFKEIALKDKEVRRIYDELGPEYEAISLLIRARNNKNMSHSALAEKMGTKQSAISRFESGTYHPTMVFLYRLAHALGVKLKVTVSVP